MFSTKLTTWLRIDKTPGEYTGGSLNGAAGIDGEFSRLYLHALARVEGYQWVPPTYNKTVIDAFSEKFWLTST